MKSFWIDKPVNITKDSKNYKVETIIPVPELLIKINNEIELNKFQLDYSVIQLFETNDEKLDSIMQFINKNYVTSYDGARMFLYSKSLFKFCMHDALLIEFYPKGKTNIVGYILGKKTPISLYKEIFDSCSVDFLCIIPNLRNMGIASFMINVLTRELILHFPSVIGAYYTIDAPIKSPSFNYRNIYHRLINIPNLCKSDYFGENINQKKFIEIYNKFLYNPEFNRTINFINNDKIVNIKLIEKLYEKYINFADQIYDIYEKITLEEFINSFINPSFYHFIIYNEKNIESYICFFRIDTFNNQAKFGYRTGYCYYLFFEDTNLINDSLEFINEYIYKKNIFDKINYYDISNIDFKKINCTMDHGTMKYYMYNIKCPRIETGKNGINLI